MTDHAVTERLAAAKLLVLAEVQARGDQLIAASHAIFDHPELAFEEQFAADLLCSVLEEAGLEVERAAYGLETAFVARAGSGSPVVALLCEYDALPGIGHACGHNLIATMSLGAGLAAARLAGELGPGAGTLLVIGTPAEEEGAGKVVLAESGAFAGVDAAMMIHPADSEIVDQPTLACSTWQASYSGTAAHASSFPWQGRNALDAAVLGYNAIAALRQHIEPTQRIHGIFREGGDKPNIVPARAVAEWWVRSRTSSALALLNERVLACLRAGADAAGCRVEIATTCPDYFEMWTNAPLVELFAANATAAGRHPAWAGAAASSGSTDMGNVSHLLPAIHPRIAVAPPGVGIHSERFARYARDPEGDRAVVDGATALAATVADLWLSPRALAQVRAAFEAQRDEASALAQAASVRTP